MKPVKILLVCRMFPPPIEDGMTRYVYLLAKYLMEQGQEVTVLASGRNPRGRLRQEIVADIPVYRHPVLQNLKYATTRNKTYEKILTGIIREKEIHVVVLQHPFHAEGAINVRSALLNSGSFKRKVLPLVYICHTASLVEKQIRDIEPGYIHDVRNEVLERKAFHQSDTVIAVSETLKNNLKKLYGIPGEKIIHVRTGIERIKPSFDLSIHRELRALKKKGFLVVLYVGRESWEKGTDLLPGIIKATLERNKKVYFALIGIEKSRWAEFALTSQVILLPWLDDRALFGVYEMTDVLMVPSRRDSMPYVMLEAMSMGVIPVVSDCDGPGEVILHGENGLKSSYTIRDGKVFIDPVPFAEKIIAVAENRELADKIRYSAKRYTENHHRMDQQINSFLQVIHHLTEL